jgi:hypothetical protein
MNLLRSGISENKFYIGAYNTTRTTFFFELVALWLDEEEKWPRTGGDPVRVQTALYEP